MSKMHKEHRVPTIIYVDDAIKSQEGFFNIRELLPKFINYLRMFPLLMLQVMYT